MKKVAVLQSNYIPWKGYFDIINDVDLFIFYDDVQYTTRDWRNRNKIKTSQNVKWLTLPVGSNTSRFIYEVELVGTKWKKQHYSLLQHSYARTPFFHKYKEFLEYVYFEKEWKYLYELNRYLIIEISQKFLNIKTEFFDSRDFSTYGTKHEKLLSLVKAANASHYISGPAARDYIVEKDYEDAGIKIIWKDYNGYPEYSQLYPPFEHNVSVLDLLFNVGEDAYYYIWGWRDK